MPSHAPNELHHLHRDAEPVTRRSEQEAEGRAWTDGNDQAFSTTRPIHSHRRAALEGALLTRTYSGRPHVPGEDSGSDLEDDRITYTENVRPQRRDDPRTDLVGDRERPSLYDAVPSHLPGIQPSLSSGDVPERQTDAEIRDMLENYEIGRRQRAADNQPQNSPRDRPESYIGSSRVSNRPETPIRARRAPPRPSEYSLEETIDRAAVFERRLERALREYRTARRAWSTLNNPYSISAEHEIQAQTMASTSTPLTARTSSSASEGSNINSVHEALRSTRRIQHSTEESASPDLPERRGLRQPFRRSPLPSGRHLPWWQRESESFPYSEIHSHDRHSATERASNHDRYSRDYQIPRQPSVTNTNVLMPYYSAIGYRERVNEHRDRLQRLVQRTQSQHTPSLTSGPLFQGIGGAQLDSARGSISSRTSLGSRHNAPRSDGGALNHRRTSQNARALQRRDTCKDIQRPKAVLQFLGHLREDTLTREQACDLATELGLHDQNLEQDSKGDLPMSIEDLPEVEYSSWLETGAAWEGVQVIDSQEDKLEPSVLKDQMTVKVVLHSVDWKNMTLSGTMEAQQLRRERKTESFFTGEIIDFRNHGLDTYRTLKSEQHIGNTLDHFRSDGQASDYRYQDIEVDLLHWPMLGPFKREIDRALAIRQAELRDLKRRYDPEDHHSDSRSARTENQRSAVGSRHEYVRNKTHSDTEGLSLWSGLTTDEASDIGMHKTGQLLSSTAWLNNNLNKAGWILMRWKEQCFVPPKTQINAINSLSQVEMITSGPRRQLWTTVEAEREEADTRSGALHEAVSDIWGLSIRGFYYVALHRQTGKVEALYHDPGSVLYQKLEMKPSCSPDDGGLRTRFDLVEFR